MRKMSKALNLPQARTLRGTMSNARYLLQEAQQVPLRLSQEDGWLSSLIILEENVEWWSGVRRSLEQSRRGSSYALVAQISMAAFAFALTVLSAFGGQLGNFTVALQLSSGCIWLWMLPVIMGWICKSLGPKIRIQLKVWQPWGRSRGKVQSRTHSLKRYQDPNVALRTLKSEPNSPEKGKRDNEGSWRIRAWSLLSIAGLSQRKSLRCCATAKIALNRILHHMTRVKILKLQNSWTRS